MAFLGLSGKQGFKLTSLQLLDLIHNVRTNTVAGMAREAEAGTWATF